MAGVEIERKWIVLEAPSHALKAAALAIDQGYLTIGSEGAETRIRRADERCTLTVKSGGGMVRAEHEIELTPDQFATLWPATEGRRLQKLRHRMPLGAGLQIELDVYSGSLSGLVVAEVEFDDPWAAEAFEVPHWFDREVTADPGYRNQRLALQGLPPSA